MGYLATTVFDSLSSPSGAVSLILVLSLIYYIASWLFRAVYNVYFHPLRSFPGPKRAVFLPALRSLRSLRGLSEWQTLGWHDKYGDVVRTGPDILTFTNPDAWKDVYGRTGADELKKARPKVLDGPPPHDIVAADWKTHARYRRVMLPAFSQRNLNEQEDLVRGYVDMLMVRLNEHASQSGQADLVYWFTSTTFDIVGDLAFGEDLGGLSAGKTNNWIESIEKAISYLPIIVLVSRLPAVGAAFDQVLARFRRHAQAKNKAQVLGRMHRLRSPSKGGHFLTSFSRSHTDAGGLYITESELAVNLDIFMVAGSETTATLLSGLTYLLLITPHALEQLKAEIRGAFETQDAITFVAVGKLPYLLACINEGLRMYPPVPLALLREVPAGQVASIAGYEVPGKTRVGVPQLAAFNSAHNFHRPRAFLPERWLPDAQHVGSPFFGDRRDVLKPFSFGPRDCIGKNLAMHEMRLVVARLWWDFDLTLHHASRGWTEEQRVYGLWRKPPLMVHLRPRQARGA